VETGAGESTGISEIGSFTMDALSDFLQRKAIDNK
jgi:hypothetical protein